MSNLISQWITLSLELAVCSLQKQICTFQSCNSIEQTCCHRPFDDILAGTAVAAAVISNSYTSRMVCTFSTKSGVTPPPVEAQMQTFNAKGAFEMLSQTSGGELMASISASMFGIRDKRAGMPLFTLAKCV